MDVVIVFKPRKMTAHLWGEPGKELFTWRLVKGTAVDVDPYWVRDYFARVRTPTEAREFLNVTGLFAKTKKTINLPLEQIGFQWATFRAFQDLVKKSRLGTVGHLYEVLARTEFEVSLPKPICVEKEISTDEFGRPEFFVCLEVETALEAIAATIFIEQQAGIACRQCERPACSRIYRVASKHKRQYCSHACARKANKEMKREERSKTMGGK